MWRSVCWLCDAAPQLGTRHAGLYIRRDGVSVKRGNGGDSRKSSVRGRGGKGRSRRTRADCPIGMAGYGVCARVKLLEINLVFEDASHDVE